MDTGAKVLIAVFVFVLIVFLLDWKEKKDEKDEKEKQQSIIDKMKEEDPKGAKILGYL